MMEDNIASLPRAALSFNRPVLCFDRGGSLSRRYVKERNNLIEGRQSTANAASYGEERKQNRVNTVR